MPNHPPIAITMGDPCGIGPEVTMRALAQTGGDGAVVIGDAARLKRAGEICGLDITVTTVNGPEDVTPGTVNCIDLANVPTDLPFGKVDRAGGQAAYDYIERAVALAMEGKVASICTAPINKEALHLSGHKYPGHTELLAELSGTNEVSMMLTAPGLRVIHVTTHIGLIDAIARIDPPRVERTIRRGAELLAAGGIERPRIGVCGINPHAGENGLFGHGEEEDKIIPAVQTLTGEGYNVEGPLPADTLFFRARRGDFDLVVAMYHDQGHGPVKVLGIEAGVNVTVGLPFVRTSVDHGTAFDIAGTGKADGESMNEALRQARQLAPVVASQNQKGRLPESMKT
ncbi:MAG: 4-hydroxythreonine-4-phosphate dehydrogenase PdxA [Pseudomonadota bacterium]|nr:4-hydroxythreonine-4-phosphate dehydrogenase PdxA [Pseudomonadota bacterium]